MTSRLFVVLMCAALAATCAQPFSGTATPAGPSPVTSAAVAGVNAGGSTGTTPAKAGERPWQASLVWTVAGIQWAGMPGQATSTFGGRCSVPSDYVISATFEGEATHAGRVTGTTEHCSQITWGPTGPMGAAYSDGRGTCTSANGSTLVLRYGTGTTGFDPATGETWFHDFWTFNGGTGLFSGATGGGEEGGRFMDFNALLAGAPVAMWMEGTITYDPSVK
jgi:hypothetical protein